MIGSTAPQLEITYRDPTALRPYERNARRHPKRQLVQIATSMRKFGFTNPVLITPNNLILAGHGRVEAAKMVGLALIPTIILPISSDVDRRGYVLADNKIALNAGWDAELLASELRELAEVGFDVEITGFMLAEVDLTIEASDQSSISWRDDADDVVPALMSDPVTQTGDVWLLGRHRLLCDDARSRDAIRTLMGGDLAQMIFTDPPYNVPIDGHVSGLGRNRHREFAMAAGEMSATEFTAFLVETLGHAASVCSDGAIAFVCMDWRHLSELSEAGRTVFSQHKNVCVWTKTNGGMGTFYRSQHEFIFVYKIGDAPHINNFRLGESGRYRTNVWNYPGSSHPQSERASDLAMHPTVKPVVLVKDAMLDCSRRGGIILDIFGGSGTTLIAAERSGRTARLIECDALYCDLILRRYEHLTGRQGKLLSTGEDFETVSLRSTATTNMAGKNVAGR